MSAQCSQPRSLAESSWIRRRSLCCQHRISYAIDRCKTCFLIKRSPHQENSSRTLRGHNPLSIIDSRRRDTTTINPALTGRNLNGRLLSPEVHAVARMDTTPSWTQTLLLTCAVCRKGKEASSEPGLNRPEHGKEFCPLRFLFNLLGRRECFLSTTGGSLRLGIGSNVLGIRWVAGLNSGSLLGCL